MCSTVVQCTIYIALLTKEVVGGTHKLLVYAYAHVLMIVCTKFNVKIFTVQKKFAKEIFTNNMHWQNW